MNCRFLKLKDSNGRDMLVNPDRIEAIMPSTDGRTYSLRMVDDQELPTSSTFSGIVNAIQYPIRPYSDTRP